MGCLIVNTALIQTALSVTASSTFATYKIKCETPGIGSIGVSACSPIICKVGIKDGHLIENKINCSLICSIDRDQKYIIVNPDIIWLPQDWGVDSEFTVYSNVEWIIE